MKKINLAITLIFLFNLVVYSQHTVTIKKGDDKNFTYFTLQGDTTKYSFKAKIAEYENRFEDAAIYTVKGIKNNEFKDIPNAYYDAAFYSIKLENNEMATKYILKSIESGWSDLAEIDFDSDLKILKESPEWKTKIEPRIIAYYKHNDKRLAKIFAEDQYVRINGLMNAKTPIEDSIRRTIVIEMIEKRKLNSAHDYYKAGFIMHHGNTTEDYLKAQELLSIAIKKEGMHKRTPWLYAASKDRLLLSQGKPQWYGTQNMTVVNGKIAMDPKLIDTTAVSPARRKELNAPSIETLRGYLKNFKSN